MTSPPRWRVLARIRSGELTVETVGNQLGWGVAYSCEGDAFILFRLHGFSVNSFDRPPHLGAVGAVVYMLSMNSLHRLLLWSDVALVISSFIVDSRGEAGSCLRSSSRSSIMAKISTGTCCSKTHNDLLHHINNCLPIEIQLEKRCIKFIYNIINSEHSLHSRIALYSLYNGDTISCISTKCLIKIGIVLFITLITILIHML